MADAMGLDPVKDKEEVIGFVNRYRNTLYNSFDRVQLFDELEQCFSIQTFRQKCSGEVSPYYYGFTATLDMDGIMGAWESLSPISTRSRWREMHRGKGNPAGSDVEIIPVNGYFSTERDMTSLARLSIYAHNKGDSGKQVVVVAVDDMGKSYNLSFTLSEDTHAYVNEMVCRIVSVTLPADLCGPVSLYQNGDYLLSKYPTGVPTPQYKRYKVNDVPSNSYVLVQSARSYIPISEDHEMVELGDQLVIEAAGKFFKFSHSTLDAKELRAGATYRDEMFSLIEGWQSRKRGNEKNDSRVNFAKNPRKVRKTALPGYRSRRNRSRWLK
tara:strand:+ start:6105 stop:7082 length:978 start_codon:yes stop_codon:yes gene_type:complete